MFDSVRHFREEELSLEWFWVPDESKGYSVAFVKSRDEDGVTLVNRNTKKTLVMQAEALERYRIHDLESLRRTYEDMVRMEDVNEATILHNVRHRFLENDIYTNIGSILVSVNPFNWDLADELYNSEYVNLFRAPPNLDDSTREPHLFSIPSLAYHTLQSEGRGQSLIISGESGAGKTEATKKCLQFLSEVAGSSTANLATRILAANPILEAFGNAKTVRNDNSSRFGKWMETQYDRKGQLVGARIVSYLLERSRIVRQNTGERNYHIFFQLCSALPDAERARLHVADGSSYHYLVGDGRSVLTVSTIDDGKDFGDTELALQDMNFTADEIFDIWRVTAAVLHLGNVEFTPTETTGDEGSTPSPDSRPAVAAAADLLGVTVDVLAEELCSQLLSKLSEVVRVPQSVEKAAANRDALAKSLYGNMFTWLVGRINRALLAPFPDDPTAEGSSEAEQGIGILDIFGFEIFEDNSFEQLCINYCNEKLQQHFNTHVFKEEEKCYIAEGIDISSIEYEDNDKVLELIEHPQQGLFSKLGDAVTMKKTDDWYLSEVKGIHIATPCFISNSKGKRHHFGVRHYAGDVVYNVQGFVSKNQDDLMDSLRAAVAASTVPFVGEMLLPHASTKPKRDADSDAPALKAHGGRSRGPQSQSGMFKTQLDALMTILSANDPHYIRCIKPNSNKAPLQFDGTICLRQLNYAGVFEAVRIRQLGYPFRHTYIEFCRRYFMLVSLGTLRGPWGSDTEAYEPEGAAGMNPSNPLLRDMSLAMVAELKHRLPELEEVQFGHTMVLYRAAANRVLERERNKTRNGAATCIARAYRLYLVQKQIRKLRALQDHLINAMRSNDAMTLDVALQEAGALSSAAPPANFRIRAIAEAGAAREAVAHQQAAISGLEAVWDQDPVEQQGQFERTVAAGTDAGLHLDGVNTGVFPHGLSDAAAASWRAHCALFAAVSRKLLSVHQRKQAIEDLEAGMAAFDKAAIDAALQLAGELQGEWGDVLGGSRRTAADGVLEEIAAEGQLLAALEEALCSHGITRDDAFTFCSRVCSARPGEAPAPVRPTEVSFSGVVRAAGAIGATGATVKTPEGRSLLSIAEALSKARSAFLDAQWDGIKAAVEDLDGVPRDRLPVPVQEELSNLTLACDNVAGVNKVKVALAVGTPSGAVGEMNTRTVSTGGLDAAIDWVEALPAVTDQLETMLNVAKVMRKLRQAVVAEDWVEVEATVAAAGGDPDLAAAVEVAAGPELHAVVDELENRQNVALLEAALRGGGAGGQPGNLDAAPVDVATLDDAVRQVANTAKSQEAVRLLSVAAKVVRPLRRAQQAGDWEEVARVVSPYVADGGAIDALPPACQAEVRLAVADARNKEVVAALERGLAAGRVEGTVGRVNVLHVGSAELEAALAAAQSCGVLSPEARRHVAIGGQVVAIRKAVAGGDWATAAGGARDALGAPGDALPEAVAAELILIRDEGDTRRVLASLRAALARGGPVGMVGQLDAGALEVDALQAALAAADGVPLHSAEARSVRATADLVLAMRRAMAAGDWKAAEAAVIAAEAADAGLDGAARDEVTATRAHVDNWRVVDALSQALRGGGATLRGDALDVSGVEVGDVRTAVALGEALGKQSPTAEALIAFGGGVIELRNALAYGDWATATDALARVQAIASQEPAAGVAAAELRAAQAAVDNHTVVHGLQEALADGAAGGRVGALDTATVDTGRLAAALARAAELGTLGADGEALVWTTRTVLALRQAARGNNWEAVDAALAAIDAAEAGGLEGDGAPPQPYALPPVAAAEVSTLRAEAAHVAAVSELVAALQAGAPEGTVGHMYTTCVSTEALAAAVHTMDALRSKPLESGRLLQTARTVLEVRRAVVDGDWGRAAQLVQWEEVEEEAPTPGRVLVRLVPADGRAAPPSLPAPSSGGQLEAIASAELRFVRDEVRNRKVCDALAGALGRGGPRGRAGDLVTAGVRVNELDRAIALAGRWAAPLTPRAQQLVATARLLRRLREVVRLDDWAATATIFFSEDAQALVPAPEGEAELGVLSDHLNDRIVVAALSEGLATGRAHRQGGVMELSHVDARPLEAALSKADAIGVLTAEAEALAAWGRLCLQLRTALLNGDRGGVDAVLGADVAAASEAHMGGALAPVARMVRKEFGDVKAEMDNVKLAALLKAGLREGAVRGEVDDLDVAAVSDDKLVAALDFAAESGGSGWTPDVQHLHRTALYVLQLRRAVKGGRWSAVASALAAAPREGVDAAAAEELRLLEEEAAHRTVVDCLTKALKTCRASGQAGALDLSAVDVRQLDAALKTADQLSCSTKAAASLYAAGRLIRRLRVSMSDGDWREVEAIVAEVRLPKEESAARRAAAAARLADDAPLGLHAENAERDVWYNIDPVAADEVRLADIEVVSRGVDTKLREALVAGRPLGTTGALSLASVSIDSLDDAIEYAQQAPRVTDASARLLHTAVLVRDIRVCLMEEPPRWEDVAALVVDAREALADGAIDGLCVDEVGAMEDEVNHAAVSKALVEALGRGQVRGHAGQLDTAGMDAGGLEKAVDLARRLGTKTAATKRLLVTAAAVLELRRAVARGDWARVRSVLDQCRQREAATTGGASPLAAQLAFEQQLAPEARQEVHLLVEESNDQAVVALLASAVGTGCVGGRPAAVDASGVDVARLEDAINNAVAVGCNSPRARQLLAAAQLLRKLRAGVAAGNWDDVEDALEDGGGGERTTTPEAAPEVALIRHAAEDRRILATLEAALAKPGLAAAASTSPLDDALQAVQSMTCRSSASVALLSVVSVVRQLRAAQAAGDWDAVGLALAELEDSGLEVPRACAGEVTAARAAAANRTALDGITAALGVGRPSGTVGAVDVGAVSAAELLLAVQRADRVEPKTPALVAAVASARAVADLRQALVTEQWDAVGPAAAAARAAAAPGSLPPEVALVQGHVENRRVEAALLAALRQPAGETSALTAAVAAAATVEAVSPQVATLLDYGKAMLGLRRAVAAGDTPRVLQAVEAAEDVARGHQRRLGLQRFGDTSLPPSAPPSAPPSPRSSPAELFPGAQLSASEAATIRQADRLTRREIKAARGLLQRRHCLSALHDAMATGRLVAVSAPGGILSGDVDVTAASAEPLEAAVQAVVESGSGDDAEVAHVLAAARSLRHVRQATIAEDWARVREVVADAHTRFFAEGVAGGLPDHVAAEFRGALCAAVGAQVSTQVVAALGHGAVGGTPGALDTTTIHVAGLDAAVRAATNQTPAEMWAWTGGSGGVAEGGVCLPPRLSKLVATATRVQAMREAVLDDRWADVRQVVGDMLAAPAAVAAVAGPELDLVAAELNHRAVLEGPLADALVTGGPSGPVGSQGAPATVDVSGLDGAIGHAAAVGANTPAAARLVQSAVALRRLRAAFQAENWPLLADLVSQVDAVEALPAIAGEVDRYRAEVSQRCVVRDLEAALSTGGGVVRATGADGSTVHSIDVGAVRVDHLETAVAQAKKFGTHSEEASLLLHTAQFMLTLRGALVGNDLPAMVAALQRAGDQQLAATVQTELMALLQEFDDRAICAELEAALAADGLAPGEGSPPASAARLQTAIAYSEQLGPRSRRSRSLLRSAKLVCQLRVALVAGRPEDAVAALGAVSPEAVCEEAAEEVALARRLLAATDAASTLANVIATAPVVVFKGGERRPAVAPQPPTAALHDLDTALKAVRDEAPALAAAGSAVRAMRLAVLRGAWEDVPEAAEAAAAAGMVFGGEVDAALAAEVGGVRALCEVRERFAGLAAALEGALSDVGNPAGLEAALVAAEAAREPPACAADLSLPARIAHGRHVLREVVDTKVQLAAAMRVMQPLALQAAIARAEAVGYAQPDLAEAQDYHARLQALVGLASTALDTLDAGEMREVLAEAERLGVTLEADGQLRRMLALPARARLQLQLKRALRRNDPTAVAKTTMEIKRLFFSEHQGVYEFGACPALRPMADFNAAFGRGGVGDDTGGGLPPPWLSFSPHPLHTPLTRVSVGLAPAALELNTQVLGYCHDRPFSEPDALAEVAVGTALTTPLLRDELYAQLVRHVSGNPREASVERGWELLLLALESFPPSEDMENFLEAFLRDNRRVDCVFALHLVVFMGPRTALHQDGGVGPGLQAPGVAGARGGPPQAPQLSM